MAQEIGKEHSVLGVDFMKSGDKRLLNQSTESEDATMILQSINNFFKALNSRDILCA